MTSTTTQAPTKTRKSRASRAADRAQADQATVTPITAAGRSATGDNGGGRKPKPEPQPKAEAKTVKLSKTPKAVTATAGVQTFDRHRGLAVKGNQQEQATGPNGAITSEAAMKAAEKLARKLGDGWTAKVETFPRFMATVTPLEPKGSEPIVCQCRYGHRDEDAAHDCSVRLAHAHSLSI